MGCKCTRFRILPESRFAFPSLDTQSLTKTMEASPVGRAPTISALDDSVLVNKAPFALRILTQNCAPNSELEQRSSLEGSLCQSDSHLLKLAGRANYTALQPARTNSSVAQW